MFDFLDYKFTAPIIALCSVTGLILIFQVMHYILVYGRIIFHKRKSDERDGETEALNEKGVSIIIVANNNSSALQDELLKILEQNYPLFEVIVVNEHSTDDSEFVLYVLQQTYPHLKVINLQPNANKFSDRKFSLSIGIRSAKYDTVVLSDIISEVKDFDWLKNFVAPFQRPKKILVGYTAVKKTKGLFNQLVQYYHATWTMNSLGSLMLGMPLSADGGNMAYDKNFFFKKGGLIAQYRDDCSQEDYFISRFATKNNTEINLNKDSFIYAPAFSSYASFRRNAYARFLSHKIFPTGAKFRLALLPLSTLFFYLILIFLLIIEFPWQYILIPFVIKWVVQNIYYKKCMKRLGIEKNWFFSPLYEIYFIFFNFNLRLKKFFHRKKKHKIKWE
ncbi:MAG: glycosyltransferase [Bacteroidales bacterium]|nr:glycosyltransferase [Bacteroidales bacterium]